MPKSKQPTEKGLPSKTAANKIAVRTAAVSELKALPKEKQSRRFHIVGIGASAGGLAAIEAFFKAIPATTAGNMGFIIVQHLSPTHKSILTELVQRFTEMRVFEAMDGMRVKPDCIYIIPPNRDMALLNGKLQLFELDPSRAVRHPIDFFFRSLASDQRERAICIVLSGTGSDGMLGVRAIKGEGGIAIAQTPESTEFDGMPQSAISTGLLDYVLAPEEMPAQLFAYLSLTGGKDRSAIQPALEKEPDTLAKICILLRAKTGRDFSQYKQSTITRRIERRMAVHQIDRTDEYLRYLQQNSGELVSLSRDLLIGVTSFFRDDEAFAALENLAIPALLARVPLESAVRIWVCACSTGEEAYSIAILLQEQMERTSELRHIQIFATDIDPFATNQARAGIFPASIAADVSPERLARFFIKEPNGAYRISKLIRDYLVFSEQDVLKDPPFSKLDLISCRNLLIYLNGEVQERLIPIFHYALQPGGILFLGSAESIGEKAFLFESVDRKARIYRKKSDGRSGLRAEVSMFGAENREVRPSPSSLTYGDQPVATNYRQLTEQTLLSHFEASAVLVTGRGETLYFHGRTGNYLEPALGNATSNIVEMARDGLRRDLSTALRQVVSKRNSISVQGLQVKGNGREVMVNLTILPVGIPRGGSDDLFLVVLDERAPADSAFRGAFASSGTSDERILALEQKLRDKDEYSQTVVEEMETSSEELKSSNEEMQSVNEEMQSANEELETSREELQSVNEELATVNTELQQKVADLSRINNDMNNLLAATGVGTLFVDHQLRISRFTPSITQIFNFIESDVGRPMAHIVSNLVGYERLLADVKTVLETLIPIEIEVQSKRGAWYLLSIRPYRTLENVIEGGVITFVDITKHKLAEQALAEATYFRRAAQIETVGIASFRTDGIAKSANDAFLHMTGYQREDLDAGKLTWSLITPEDWLARQAQAREELSAKGRANPYEGDYLRKDGTRGTALFAAWRLNESEIVLYTISFPGEKHQLTAAAVS